MAPLPNVNHCLRISIRGSIAGDIDVVNRWYMTYGGSAPVAADLVALMSALGGHLNSRLIPHQHEDFFWLEAHAVDLTSSTAAEGSASFSHGGSLTGGKLPADACVVIGKPCARRSRGGHGRVYLLAGDASKLSDEQTWDGTFLNNVESDWGAMVGDIAGDVWSGGGTMTDVIVSYYNGNSIVTHGTPPRARNVPVVRATPLVDGVINYDARPRIGSQRRRLGR